MGIACWFVGEFTPIQTKILQGRDLAGGVNDKAGGSVKRSKVSVNVYLMFSFEI